MLPFQYLASTGINFIENEGFSLEKHMEKISQLLPADQEVVLHNLSSSIALWAEEKSDRGGREASPQKNYIFFFSMQSDTQSLQDVSQYRFLQVTKAFFFCTSLRI